MVVSPHEACFLDICIPTYNRRSKLDRLLSILEQETAAVAAEIKIRITVSDNHSTDATQAMLRAHSFRGGIVVRSNPENVGALRNIWGLYASANAEYLWTISDDDVPKPGSLQRILDTLLRRAPTVLTFEFDQPPGAAPKRHGNGNGVEEIANLSAAVPHVLVLGKLTKQVFSAKQLQIALQNVSYGGDTGYGWLLVILEVIRLAASPRILVDHEFLAGCDEEYANLTDGLTPQFWDDYLLLLDHEVVRVNCPEYARQYRCGHPTYMVKMLYGVMSGRIGSSDKGVFRDWSRRLPFDPRYLRNPFVAVQWASLQLGIPAFPVVCDLTDQFTAIKQHFAKGLKRV